jgi:tetrahydromethanopterin S-methyltransferase subunit C
MGAPSQEEDTLPQAIHNAFIMFSISTAKFIQLLHFQTILLVWLLPHLKNLKILFKRSMEVEWPPQVKEA